MNLRFAIPALLLTCSQLSCTLAQEAKMPLGAIAKADPDTDYGLVASHVAQLLSVQHYDKKDFDDSLGMPQKALKNFVTALDPEKLYFYQSEIDLFEKKYGTKLDDFILLNDLTPAIEIYSVYKKHAQLRFEKIKTALAEGKFDFATDQKVTISRENSPWAKDEAECDALWQARLTSDVLSQRLQLKQAEEKKKEKEAEKKETEKKEDAEKPADAPKPAAEVKPAKKPETPEQKVLARYKRMMEAINENDEEDVTNFILSAISQTYDPHSEYMSAPEEDRFRVEMNKQLIGIGAQLQMEDGLAVIDKLVAGAPAHMGGQLKAKDKVIGVGQGENGEIEDVEGLKLDKIVSKIRGEEGTIVRLKVIPAADPAITKEILIKRAKVEMKESRAKAQIIEHKLDDKKFRMGWMIIDSFYADMENGTTSLTKDLKVLLERLMAEKIDGLAIDLRGNGGGSLDEALAMTGLFVDRGPVVQVKSFNGRIDSKPTKSAKAMYNGPLVVLTDRTSASASEIFAAAMQDYGRAVVVGDKSTFGKGTVQTIIDVARAMARYQKSNRAGALKVTIQKFYRIAGGSTQLKGVVPDIHLPSRLEALEIGEDKLKDPLPYDEIPKAKYELSPNGPLPVTELGKRSTARLEKEPEFAYIKEDITRLKEQVEKNVISLNEAQRIKEIEENKARINQRKKDRKERATLANKNGDPYTVYELNVDNVSKPELETVEKTKEKSSQFMIGGDEDDEDDAPETFIHDLDPTKLETLKILEDLMDLSSRAQTVKREESP